MKYLIVLFFLLPFTSFAWSVTPTTGTSLSEGVIDAVNGDNYRYYLTYDDPSAPIGSWPPTSGYICGYIESQGEGGAPDGKTLDYIYGRNMTPQASCAPEDTAGVWNVLETDTGSHNSTIDFTIEENEVGGSGTTSSATTTATEHNIDTIYRGFTLFFGIMFFTIWNFRRKR